MKRLFSILMVAVMLSTTVFASAKTPDFLTETYTNYTMDSTSTTTVDNCDEIVALLEEFEMSEEVDYFVDMKALLQSLFNTTEKMQMQIDVNDNYDKIQLALTADADQKIDINSNLNIGFSVKMGVWADIDITDAENPVVDIIYSHPFFNKYIVISVGEYLKESPEIVEMIKLVFNKSNMEYLNKSLIEMYAEHATIKSRGNQYTVTVDNEGFTACIDDFMEYVLTIVSYIDQTGGMENIASAKDWKILGEKGIETVYTLKGGKIDTEETTVDFSIDIAQIYKAIVGEEWPYTSADTIDFTVTTSSRIANIGRTKVNFPEITEENSISFEDLMPDYDTYDNAEKIYPSWYVSGNSEQLPVIDGDVYVPLRKTIEQAYEDSAVIDYKDGVITVTSEFFPGFKTLKMTVNDDKIYADGETYYLGSVFTINGSTYVNSSLFTDVFGWNFAHARYNILEDYYYYTFYTE